MIGPISPDILVFLYDKGIYSIEHQNRRITVKDEPDIHSLNDHQLLNCISNIYLSGDIDSRVARVLPEVKARRAASGEKVHIFTKRPGGEDNHYFRADKLDVSLGEQAMLVTSTYYPRPLDWPRFLRWRTGGYYFYNGSGVGQVRNAHAVGRIGDAPFRKIKTGR